MMTKAAAIHAFWASFGAGAYEENAVPEDAPFPYIAYSFSEGARGEDVPLSAAIYCRGTSWAEVNRLTEQIAERFDGGLLLACDGGRIWLRRGTPFAQSDKSGAADVKKRTIRLRAMFLTEV